MTDSAVPLLPKPALARRLVAAFCLTLMLCLAGTAIGIRSLQRVDAATQEAIGHSLVVGYPTVTVGINVAIGPTDALRASTRQYDLCTR